MSNLPAFSAYAAAFEETLADDNWTRLEPFFAPTADYRPGDGTQAVGREAVIQALKHSVDSLERKCDSRSLVGEPQISEAGDTITLKFTLKYTRQGSSDLILVGIETARYEQGVIQELCDEFEDPDALVAWRRS